MATAQQIADVRRYINDTDVSQTYTDGELEDKIDAFGTFGAASVVWGEKAAKYAELVRVSEGDSTQELGELHKNALRMSDHYRGLVGTEVGEGGSGFEGNSPRTKAIVRP